MPCSHWDCLPALAEGRVLPEMEAAVGMAYRLKADLGHMLQEHKEIVAALEALKEAASSEDKEEAVHFAEKLMLHAQIHNCIVFTCSSIKAEARKVCDPRVIAKSGRHKAQ